MRQSFIKIIICYSIFFLLIPALSSAGQHKVVRVVDGDTIVVNYHGKYEKIRFLCVDTPESVHPDKRRNTPMGKVASIYTGNHLAGKYVDLEFEGKRRGYYGRLLAYVFIDGENFNVELVRQGLSPYYTKYGLSQKYDQEFREAERYARKHGVNIWGDPDLAKEYLRLKSKWGQKKSRITVVPITIPTQSCVCIGNML
ncbi:MAG: thermonuclease family protein [Deltaproteobacteria bacterium]|nr:thermonuclease family protein [Deltaproteobacteria bacterium]